MQGFSVRQFLKNHTTYALRRAARDLWREVRLSRRHHTAIRKAKRVVGAGHLKLNIGCGTNIKAGWINIDMSIGGDTLSLDVRERLPFPDASALIVYSEHFFEHLEYPGEALAFLRESWRVLVPGGVFSMGIPDFELEVTAYVERDPEFYRRRREHYAQPVWVNTRMHVLNHVFRQDREHKCSYDMETLEGVLASVGFVAVVRRPFDPQLDTPRREWGTLYAEAKKPDR
jgi:predicted SAM-dependent methyltransferase